ncbi:MAG: nuclear transport factor 2 family protein [Sphingomonadales bacterium]|nr:nuclear transport factor 2 family protein [Sphingomonadales bacterium]
MTDFNKLVDRYIAVWNEPDAKVRSKAIAALWTEGATFTDPLADVEGHEGIGAVIAKAREMFPGCAFRALPNVDGHHNVARFGWELMPEAGGESIAAGFDVAVLAEDGRVSSILGFLDKVPGG